LLLSPYIIYYFFFEKAKKFAIFCKKTRPLVTAFSYALDKPFSPCYAFSMITLLIIDPQNDFCVSGGSLFVPGAEGDCGRTAAFLDAAGSRVDSVVVTLDCHQNRSIFHPAFWHGRNGAHPVPFTAITAASLAAGDYTPVNPGHDQYAAEYLAALEKGGKYALTIWPPHCLVGTPGQSVESRIYAAIARWEAKSGAKPVRFVLKGLNPLTEHYSAVRAEVPDPADPATGKNGALMEELRRADQVYIAGEALSHCVAFTVRDLWADIPPDRMTVLADCTSPVAGFDREAFVEEFTRRGIRCADSTALLAQR
jgi:nicotinamidase-related amidase